MAKWYGKVGFSYVEETEPGIMSPVAEARPYVGDVLRNRVQVVSGEKVNSDITVNNQLSMIADPYMNQHLGDIRYASFNNTNWNVTNVEVAYPRVILTLGGVYNGPTEK